MNLVDLRRHTAPGPVMRVSLHGEPWILTRRARLTRYGSGGAWFLDAPLLRQATSGEHTIALAMRMLLVRVWMYGADGAVKFSAHVSGMDRGGNPRITASGAECFFVPDPGRDPFAGAAPCQRCGRGRRHPVVVAGLPPHDPELFQQVRGFSVDVEFGVTV